MGRYFGTDGIRGVANVTLTSQTAYNVGRFVGDYYAKNGTKRIVIGKDTRLSSSMFESLIAAGASSSGCDVYLLGYCSTPCLAYVAQKEKFDCGVMISASHNPYMDNGIKIFGNEGIKIGDEIEGLIEDFIDNPTGVEFRSGEEIGKIVEYKEGLDLYRSWLNVLYPTNLSGLRILVDLANGSNCFLAKSVLDKTGVEATYINTEPNGVNINNHCGSTHLESLIEGVRAGEYDIGLAFDGDADRVLFVDGAGNLVDGDAIMVMLAKYLKEKNLLHNNTLVVTVMSNMGVFKACEKLGINTSITAVGDKNVLDCMLTNDFSIGGEQSGHIIYKNDSNFGDGLKTALLVLQVLKEKMVTIGQAISDLRVYPQLLVNQKVGDKKIVLNDETLKSAIEKVGHELGDSGRILVRPSGTEELIRVMVEADSDELCAKYVYQIIDLIKELGYAA